MEGWVSKKRPTGLGKFKMWQRRYLAVNSEYLAYFGENERKKPKAQFRLNEIESVTLVVSDKKPDHTRFDIVCRPVVIGMVKGASEKDTMKRVYSFRASSPDDAKKWVSIINALAFGETIDVNGDIIDIMKPDVSLAIARGEMPISPRTTAPSNAPDSANLREVICDRIYNVLNIASILSPSAALQYSEEAETGAEQMRKPTFLSAGGYLCANENSTEEHLKMMIYNELGSDTELLRFLCGQFYTLICSNNRDGYDSRTRTHSFSASVSSQGPSDAASSSSSSSSSCSSPTPSSPLHSPSMRGPAVKCALKTCKHMRCRLPGILGFRASLEPRPGTPQQLFCTEHAELWVRTSLACGKCLQTPLLGELLEQPPDVLVHELISALANGTPDAKGVACRLLWVVLPVYLEHKAKHKRRGHDKVARLREERSGSDALSSVSEQADGEETSESRLSISIQPSTHHRQPSDQSMPPRPSTSNLSSPTTSPRPLQQADIVALEETSVVRTVALKTLPKQFAALMSQHCAGQEYSLPIKNALTSIMLRPSARMLKPEDLDTEEQAAMHMVVNHDGACWLAFMVALKQAPFNLREQALKEVNMLLIENPGNCSNFKRQRNWPWLIYSLMSDIPAAILGQQTADEHEELTKQRESGLLPNPPSGREFPSLSFSLSSNSDENSNPPTPHIIAPKSPLLTPPTLAASTTTTTTTTTTAATAATHASLTPLVTSVLTPSSSIASPTPISESPLKPMSPLPGAPPLPLPPPLPSSITTNSSSSSSSEGEEEGRGSGKGLFSFEQPLPDQPKRGSLSKAIPPPPPRVPSLTSIISPAAPLSSTPTNTTTTSTTIVEKPRPSLIRRSSQPDEIAISDSTRAQQPKRGSLKKKTEYEEKMDSDNSNKLTLPPSSLLLPESPNLSSLSISIDLTPLSLRDELLTSDDQIDPDLIAATHSVCDEAKSPTPKDPTDPSQPNTMNNNNISSNATNNNIILNGGMGNQRRKGAVFVHKSPGGGTLPANYRRGASPSRYGTLTGAFAVSRKGEEKNEAEEQNKLIVRVYTYSLNIMTILQYDSAIHSSSIHFRQLMLRCLNALLACTGEEKARTLMRSMFITLTTKLGTKKILDRNQLTSLSWQNLFPFFELIKTFLFQTFTFNILEEAKIRGSSHDRKKTMTRGSTIGVLTNNTNNNNTLSASSSSSSSSSSSRLPSPYAAWGHEEGFVVDLLPGVDVMADSETRRISVADPGGADDSPVLGFENGEYGFHLDAPGYYGDIALAERCSFLLRSKGLDAPIDDTLPGVTPKDLVILREAHVWYEFFEDVVELLKLLPPPVCAEKGDAKAMTDRLALFNEIMEVKALKKFCEAQKEARRSMLKKIKEGPKPSRNPFATPRRSKNNIVIDLSGVTSKSPTK